MAAFNGQTNFKNLPMWAYFVIKHKTVDAGVSVWFFKTKKQFWQVKIMSFTFKVLLKNVLQFESVYRRM